jgi:hypothetical protein
MKQANTRAARQAADALKRRARADFAAVGLDKIARNITTKVYPQRGEVIDPTFIIRVKDSRQDYVSRTEKMALGHVNGAHITTVNGGRWLAIPTEHAPRNGRGRLRPGQIGNGEPLQFISVSAHRALLVQRQRLVRRKDGTIKKFAKLNKNTQRNILKVVVYVLVRQVKLEQRLDWHSIVAAGQRLFSDQWAREHLRIRR